jgi:hypothetical protein
MLLFSRVDVKSSRRGSEPWTKSTIIYIASKVFQDVKCARMTRGELKIGWSLIELEEKSYMWRNAIAWRLKIIRSAMQTAE